MVVASGTLEVLDLGPFYELLDRWIMGSVGIANNLNAELIAMLQGLQLAWAMEIRELFCYSDSTTKLSLLMEEVQPFHAYAPILKNIRECLSCGWHAFLEGGEPKRGLDGKARAGQDEAVLRFEAPLAPIQDLPLFFPFLLVCIYQKYLYSLIFFLNIYLVSETSP